MTVAHGLKSADALTALLTVESLLFAAFAVAAIFLARREEGWDLLTKTSTFAWFTALAIVVAAFGAGASWIDVYLGGHLRLSQLIAGMSLAFGIVAIALLSIWIAIAVQRNA